MADAVADPKTGIVVLTLELADYEELRTSLAALPWAASGPLVDIQAELCKVGIAVDRVLRRRAGAKKAAATRAAKRTVRA